MTAILGVGVCWAEPRLQPARAAVDALRAESFLPSACERAFGAFWRAFTRPGDQRLLREPDARSPRVYVGLGNPAAAPLLAPAQDICGLETGVSGQAVVQVLQEREETKRARAAEILRASRSVTGY